MDGAHFEHFLSQTPDYNKRTMSMELDKIANRINNAPRDRVSLIFEQDDSLLLGGTNNPETVRSSFEYMINGDRNVSHRALVSKHLTNDGVLAHSINKDLS